MAIKYTLLAFKHTFSTLIEKCSDRSGPKGTIIGVDLSEDMLGQAQRRVQNSKWQNIELVQQDIADYSFPEQTDGILSTLALTMSPEYDQIIQRAANTLKTGRRLSIFKLKKPERWPGWLVQIIAALLKSYGTQPAHTEQTPGLHFGRNSVQFRVV